MLVNGQSRTPVPTKKNNVFSKFRHYRHKYNNIYFPQYFEFFENYPIFLGFIKKGGILN